MPPRICLHHFPSYLAADTTLISRRHIPPAAFFSVSSALHKSPLVKKASKGHPAAAPPKKGERRTFVPKKGPQREARTAAPGDRKALRNRIILSNTNALEVPWLKDLDKQNILDERIVGNVMGLSGEVVDSLRAVGAFKVGQGWKNYKRPACLIREEAWGLGKLMEGIQAGGPDGGQTVRRLITGTMRSGKSVLLLQAMAMAFIREWVVISLPDAKDLTIAQTDYAPIPDTEPVQYMQMAYTAKILSQTAEANKSVLSKLLVSRQHDLLSRATPGKTNLYQLAEFGINDPPMAWSVFTALWAELTTPNSSADEKGGARPPILLAVDSISHMLCPTHYQSVDANGKLHPIHPFDFVLIKHFIDHLSGSSVLGNGGLVLAATSKSDHVNCSPLDVCISLAEARKHNPGVTVDDVWNPLQKIDRRAIEPLTNLEVLDLNGISKDEARTIIEFWAGSGMVRKRIEDGFVSETWTMSGGGIVGQLERAVVNTRF